MRVISAYLLAVLGGKSSPTSKDIKDILGAVGAEADEDRLTALFKELEGKTIEEVVADGLSKLASVPSGGGGGVSSGGGGGGGSAPAGAAAAAKEEEKEEEEEEEDEDMGFSLFD